MVAHAQWLGARFVKRAEKETLCRPVRPAQYGTKARQGCAQADAPLSVVAVIFALIMVKNNSLRT